ncbi:hypothetical protein CWN94_01790 [Vibrio splendidus]|uniref:hypothetical protein n=1 Tax=Vibrio splendidus TaxID=29497 RepID=UPI000D39E9BD|nr:hypothetical protein [Vibrio splendidus]PTO57195.1 hypothetical protein CWN94_01790 [Vibrio splendidus]
MEAVLEKSIDQVVTKISSDPVKQLLTERLLHNLASSLNSISAKDAKKLLTLNDINFSLKVGNVLAEKQIGRKHDEAAKKAISNNNKIQQFIEKLEEHGGFYTSKQLENKLDIGKSAINNRKSRSSLFSVKVGGKVYFPKFQFTEKMEVTKPFKDVLETLSGKDSIACFFFLTETSMNHQDEEKAIYDVLKDDNQKRYVYSIIEKRARALHAK